MKIEQVEELPIHQFNGMSANPPGVDEIWGLKKIIVILNEIPTVSTKLLSLSQNINENGISIRTMNRFKSIQQVLINNNILNTETMFNALNNVYQAIIDKNKTIAVDNLMILEQLIKQTYSELKFEGIPDSLVKLIKTTYSSKPEVTSAFNALNKLIKDKSKYNDIINSINYLVKLMIRADFVPKIFKEVKQFSKLSKLASILSNPSIIPEIKRFIANDINKIESIINEEFNIISEFLYEFCTTPNSPYEKYDIRICLILRNVLPLIQNCCYRDTNKIMIITKEKTQECLDNHSYIEYCIKSIYYCACFYKTNNAMFLCDASLYMHIVQLEMHITMNQMEHKSSQKSGSKAHKLEELNKWVNIKINTYIIKNEVKPNNLQTAGVIRKITLHILETGYFYKAQTTKSSIGKYKDEDNNGKLIYYPNIAKYIKTKGFNTIDRINSNDKVYKRLYNYIKTFLAVKIRT